MPPQPLSVVYATERNVKPTADSAFGWRDRLGRPLPFTALPRPALGYLA